MKIQIKNVGNSVFSNSAISELSRSGFPEGTIVENVTFTPSNNACYWSNGDEDCVAYVGETCIIIEDEKPKKLKDTSDSITVGTAAMSHLSDAQMEIKFDADMAYTRLNFVKSLLIKYTDTSQFVSRNELTELWNEVIERQKKWN
ncbi:hypothetical protein [Parabacteroides sp. PF5-9]|uniref:hypothetical protein n=1 Tax=Parabacteroides sp. PF5-9 TaxID=1742404 RepID=UPI002475E926|nr:hypothetical protein [Parabacteroides sp. PF5-9]MDH6358962.1 hypothetical protein [Parabacteroides sp. PF5-9]